MTVWTLMASPVDELRLVSNGTGLTAIEFAPHLPPQGVRDDADPLLARARAQLEDYFAGRLRQFDLPLAPQGSTFQQKVWAGLLTVGYAQTVSYGEIARRIGLTARSSSRAVGAANGRNPLPIVVPCHRVIGTKGTLIGYAGGLPRKQLLLDLERGAGS